MNTKFLFRADVYRKLFIPLVLISFIFSIVIDLILCWNMFVDIPESVLTHRVPEYMWILPQSFLIVINTLILPVYCLYRYLKIKKLRIESYVEIKNCEICHFVLEDIMSQGMVKTSLEGKWLSDETKEFYLTYSSYHIISVERLKKRKNGGIDIEGTIKITFHSDYLKEEDINNCDIEKVVSKHRIPAYYENMDMIYSSLTKLIQRGNVI